MKKRLFVLLVAGLLLVSMTACGNDDGKETDSDSSSSTETSTESDPLGSENESHSDSETSGTNVKIDQTVADFTEAAMTVSVYAKQATIRTSPAVATNTYAITATRGDVFTVTGVSTYWYRVELKDYKTLDDGTYYIAKTVAGDKAVLDAFVDTDPVSMTVTGDVNLRSFPSSENDSTRLDSGAYLAKDSVVSCIGESNGWCKVLYQSENDGDEEPQVYYVSSKYLKSEASDDSETTTTTESESNTESETLPAASGKG